MTSKKISRHDLKRPDEFISVATRAFEWVQDNVRIVVAAVVALLVVAIGTLAFVQYSRGQDDKAMFDYGRAVDGFHKSAVLTGDERVKGIDEAILKLQAVYENHRGTRAADFALLSVGEANFALGKFEQSANAFEQAVDRFKKEPNFRALALVGAGKAYEAQRNLDKALDAYQRANAIEGNPYKEALKGDVGRLQVLKEQQAAFQAQIQQMAKQASAPAQ